MRKIGIVYEAHHEHRIVDGIQIIRRIDGFRHLLDLADHLDLPVQLDVIVIGWVVLFIIIEIVLRLFVILEKVAIRLFFGILVEKLPTVIGGL